MTMLDDAPVQVAMSSTFSVTGGLAQDYIDRGEMIPWSGTLVVEGGETGDKRSIALGALTHRPLPMPFMVQLENPVGGDGHDGATLTGRIDTLERTDDGRWPATGYIDPTSGDVGGSRPAGEQLAIALDKAMIRGVSVDLDQVSTTEMRTKDGVKQIITHGRIIGATATPFQAFVECEIALDVDRMGLAASADIDFAADGLLATVWSPVDVFETLVAFAGAGIPVDPPSEWFEKIHFAELTPLTVLPNGRVFGHIAADGTCHIAFAGKCERLPKSHTNYAKFRNGSVLTAEGTMVRTGPIVMDTIHPDLGWKAADAMEFYADTRHAVCDVIPYDDQFGMAVVGAMRPDVDPARIRAFRGSDISPDWRNIDGYHRECCALLAVNNSGFKLPQTLVAAAGRYVEPGDTGIAVDADGEVYALVASGAFRVGPCCEECGMAADGSEAAVERDDELDDEKAMRRAAVRARFGPKPARVFTVSSVEFRDFSPTTRDKLAKKGQAMKDGSFPIPDKGALARAIQSIGRAKDYDAARRHIIKRARALDAVDMLPDDWKVAKSFRVASAEFRGTSAGAHKAWQSRERAAIEFERGTGLRRAAEKHGVTVDDLLDEVNRRKRVLDLEGRARRAAPRRPALAFHVASAEFTGTSEGARKAWESRGKKSAPKKFEDMSPSERDAAVRARKGHGQPVDAPGTEYDNVPTIPGKPAVGDKVVHNEAGTGGTVLGVTESQSPYNPGTWLEVRADDGLEYMTPVDSVRRIAKAPKAMPQKDSNLEAQWQDAAPDMSYDDWLTAEVDIQNEIGQDDPEFDPATDPYLHDINKEIAKRDKARAKGGKLAARTFSVPKAGAAEAVWNAGRDAVEKWVSLEVVKAESRKGHHPRSFTVAGAEFAGALQRYLDALPPERVFALPTAEFAGSSEAARKAWETRKKNAAAKGTPAAAPKPAAKPASKDKVGSPNSIGDALLKAEVPYTQAKHIADVVAGAYKKVEEINVPDDAIGDALMMAGYKHSEATAVITKLKEARSKLTGKQQAKQAVANAKDKAATKDAPVLDKAHVESLFAKPADGPKQGEPDAATKMLLSKSRTTLTETLQEVRKTAHSDPAAYNKMLAIEGELRKRAAATGAGSPAAAADAKAVAAKVAAVKKAAPKAPTTLQQKHITSVLADKAKRQKVRTDIWDRSDERIVKDGIKVKGGQNWLEDNDDGTKTLSIGHEIGYDGADSSQVSYTLHPDGTARRKSAAAYVDHEYGSGSYSSDSQAAAVITDRTIREHLQDLGFVVVDSPPLVAKEIPVKAV